MSLVVNLYYTGKDGNARKFAEEMVASGIVDQIRAEEGNERAELALEVFAYRIQKYIGSYAAAMGGVDCIVFTAGIGENDSATRARILKGMDWIGIDFDEEANKGRGEIEISRPGSKVRVLVIPTDEEMTIARDTKALC